MSAVWCPFATKMELQPESDSQPAIVPDQFIVHSIAAPWTPGRIYEYWRDSTNLESHFGLGYDGSLAQFIGTQTRADANYLANRRPDGHGAVSLESASNLKHTDPWTDAQVDKLVAVGIWLHEAHDIPLRICRSWDDPGYGYHRLHSQWSTGGTACPGDARVQQFNDEVFPRIKNGETSMALSDADVEKVANAVWQKMAKADGVYLAPVDAPDYSADVNNPGHYWSGRSVFADLVRRARDTGADAEAILAQAKANGVTLSELKAAVARLEARG